MWLVPAISLFVMGCVPLIALAADEWSITTSDFRNESITLDAFSSDSLTTSNSAQSGRKRPISQFLMIEHTPEQPPMLPARYIAFLAGNDVAMGAPRGIKGDNLIWENPLLGEMSIPLKQVSAIALAEETSLPASPAGSRTEDVIQLANGDSIRGIIAELDNNGISIQPTGGASTKVPLDSIRRIHFAVLGASGTAKRERGFHILLGDRTSLTAARVDLRGSVFSIAFPDGSKRDLPAAAVRSIEQVNGPVTWLSSLAPSESLNKPFLQRAWPPRMDRSVDGEPLRAGDRTYARGIGVHSYTKLDWTIDPAFKAFRTRYAIAGDWPYANVTVRILLDGKVVYEKADIRSGPISEPIIIPIQGQKTLSLEVDYGQNYDVQDRFNWIEPAFLDSIPPAKPTIP